MNVGVIILSIISDVPGLPGESPIWFSNIEEGKISY